MKLCYDATLNYFYQAHKFKKLPDGFTDFYLWRLKARDALAAYNSALALNPKEVIAVTTNKCNLKCNYCYAHSGETSLGKKENFNYSSFIKLVKKYPSIEKIRLIGGEVLLDIPLIENIIKDFPEKKVEIQSNGILIKNLPKEIIANPKIKFTIGIEPEGAGNRVDSSNNSNWSLALPSLNILSELKKFVHFIIPLGNSDSFSIFNFVDMLNTQFRFTYKINWLPILNYKKHEMNYSNHVIENTYNMITSPDKYKKNHRKYLYGWHNASIEVAAMNNSVIFAPYHCAGFNSTITMGWDGNLYNCHKAASNCLSEQIIGQNDVDMYKRFNVLRKSLKERNHTRHDNCWKKYTCYTNRQCPAEACFNDCAHDSFMTGLIAQIPYAIDDKKINKLIKNQEKEISGVLKYYNKVKDDYKKLEIENAMINGELSLNDFVKYIEKNPSLYKQKTYRNEDGTFL
ncbi:MAG: radical SAM protein [Defluviitaleaceae bacterium]|nr:radical SAM protein [Defluviitaleaceae bacterium]